MNARMFVRTSLAVVAAVAGAAVSAAALRLDAGSKLFNPCGKPSEELRNHNLTFATICELTV